MTPILRNFAADAKSLDVESFAEKHGLLFFTCSDPDSLSPQTRPQATAQLSADLLKAILNKTQSPSMLVIPIVRNAESAFRFISVGRTSNCDVVIPDGSVSKLHSIIRIDDAGRTTIEDAGSANGTFVDDEAAPKRNEGDPFVIRDRTVVCFGRASMEVWNAHRVWEQARLLSETSDDETDASANDSSGDSST